MLESTDERFDGGVGHGPTQLLRRLLLIVSVACAVSALSCRASAADASEDAGKSDCTSILARPIQPPAVTGPLSEAELPSCDEIELYYGLGQTADPKAALQCGLYQRSHPRGSAADPFRGSGVLSMLYANGKGAPRDLDVAERFVCENTRAAPAEIQLRIHHLESLRAAPADAKTFDLCDDATSGDMVGACADLVARRKDAARSQEIESMQANWSPQTKAAYASLEEAEQSFVNSRLESELNLTGSARGAATVNEESRLNGELLATVRLIISGSLPAASPTEAARVNRDLKTVYQQTMQLPASVWQYTTATPDGVAQTQRAWFHLVKELTQFAHAANSSVTDSQVRVLAANQRMGQLKDLLKELQLFG
jgi:hypothetical protein